MIRVAVMGYGTIGSGVVEVLDINKNSIAKRAGEEIGVKYILDLRDFPGDPIQEKVVHDYKVIANDPEVQIVVETMGGVEPAYTFVKAMLEAGKHVTTSNKALVAAKGAELIALAKEKNVNFMFEASVGGGIPIIRPLNSCLTADEIEEITGILNGTTNFILTLMENENLDFDEALSIADGLGYVEANPALDLDGIDAAHKICILAQNGYQKFVDFDQIQASGIRNVSKLDMDYAKKLGYRFKMIAQAKPVKDGLGIDVSATLVNLNELVANVMDSYNVVEIDNDYVNNIIYYGRGAGRYVTASAVVSDIMKTHQVERWSHDYEDCKHVYPISSSRYYVRASKPVDIPYETYYSEKDDHIYITEEIELADLKNKLNDENAVIFKVRG